MAEQSAKKEVTVTNEMGLHVRPSSCFVEIASQFEADIFVKREADRVDGKSLMSILSLGAKKGTLLSIEANGPDAQGAVSALADLIENGLWDENGLTNRATN
ncbi:MAG: HPr family phosphocarrier protein [Pirellulaceae bacterium]|nr:HPr family phosphocarrier protein [Pirellulaceae bacterium]